MANRIDDYFLNPPGDGDGDGDGDAGRDEHARCGFGLDDADALTKQVLRYLDDQAPAGTVAALGQRLRADPAARELFVHVCLLDSLLGEKFAPGRREFISDVVLGQDDGADGESRGASSLDAVAMRAISEDDVEAEPEPLEVPTWPAPPPPPTPWWMLRRTWAAAALAATVLLMIGVWTLVSVVSRQSASSVAVRPSRPHLQTAPSIPPAADAQPKPLPPPLVAMLSGAYGAAWDGTLTPPSVGQPLRAKSELILRSGLVRLTFRDGAIVVVEAPARFTPDGTGRMTLASGRMTAVVPHWARGFTVKTSTTEVVDLGTEFGVDVPEGQGESIAVMVFDGLVTLAPPATASAASQPVPQILKAGAGAKVDPTGAITALPVNPVKFVRNAEADARERAKSGSAFDRWSAYRYELARNPDVVAYYPFDAENKDKAPDRLTNASAAGAALDGRFTGRGADRPTWIAGRFAEKQALHFGGGLKRVEFPSGQNGVDFNRGGESFTVAAWVKFDPDPDNAVPRDPSAGFLSGVGHRGVLTRVVDKYERLTISAEVKGNIGLGFGLDAPVTAVGKRYAVVNSNRRATTSWQHVAVTYDQAAQQVIVFVNGENAGERAAKASPNTAFGLVGLGCRLNLDGEYHDSMEGAVDELVIVRRAMKVDEIKSMYESGKPD